MTTKSTPTGGRDPGVRDHRRDDHLPKDVTLHADNDDPDGMWGNGTTLWVADSADDKIYAYTLKTGSRDTGSEFSLHSENGAAHSIWSHGTTMFVTERDGTLGVDELKIYTYNAPDFPTLDALSVSYGSPAVTPTLAPVFNSSRLEYAADVPYNITQVTVVATAAAGVTATFVQEDGTTAQPDDDSVTSGHQVGLAVGDNVIRVRAVKGDYSRIYTVTVKRAKPEVTISAAETMAGEGHDPVFTVTRSPSAPDSLTVKLDVSETGSLVPSGSEGMKTVLIPANTAAAEHTVTTDAGDDAWDAHSTVTVALVAEADSPYTLDAANSASTEIRDDDFPAATAALAVSPATASEGGTVTVTVTVTTGSDQEPHEDGGTVTLSTAAVSAQTADYGALSETTFTLAQGDFSSVTVGGNSRYQATYTATVGIVDDTSQEGAETFTVSMAQGSDLDAQVTLGTPTSRTITIPANDAPGNAAPTFPATETGVRSVAENTASGQNVGSPVAATDTDTGDTLTYSLEGADGGSFTIVSASGQIQTKAALNYEAKSSYSVTVKVNDGTVNATKAVTISVTDVDEPPDQPAAPTVSAKSGADDSLNVSWSAPANTGRPAIDDYNVRYRIGTTGNFTSHSFSGTGRFTTIGGLTADTEYEVQVQAHNPEGDSPWSASGTARTNAATSPVSTDATLSALTLSPTDISSFQSGTLTYSVDVANSVGSVTVTPTANQASATITVNGATVASGSGQAVRVDVGSNTITIVVTAEDGNATESYTVTVTRAVSGAYDGTPQLAGANAAPWGIWGNADTLWVSDQAEKKLYAYRRSDGSRVAARDIDIGGELTGASRRTYGIWSDGTRMWVADASAGALLAYGVSDGARQSGRDVALAEDANDYANDHEQPRGVGSDGTTLWVADLRTGALHDKLYAYGVSNGVRRSGDEFDLAKSTEYANTSDNSNPAGVWTDGTTLWVADELRREDLRLRGVGRSAGVRGQRRLHRVSEGRDPGRGERCSGRDLVGRGEAVGGGPVCRQALRLRSARRRGVVRRDAVGADAERGVPVAELRVGDLWRTQPA